MRLALCAVAAALAASLTPAAAAPAGVLGEKCTLTVVPDYFGDDGWQGGELRAGPLYTGEAGTLVCSVHVNNNTHDGPAYASGSFPAVNGVVYGTTPVAYPASSSDSVALCAVWYGASGTWYWRAGNPLTGDQGDWSASPSSCGEFLVVEPVASLPPGAGPQCYDGIDNDGDGRRDYPADPDCSNLLDGSESPDGTCTTVAGVPVCASYTTETQRTPCTVYGLTVSGIGVTSFPANAVC